jgi:UDP-N-acetylmuramoyl-tripeptide--D-alanyl-D-alanine ligase
VEGFGKGAAWFPSVEALVSVLAPQMGLTTNVLVKGSRSSRMERVVEALRESQAGIEEA